MDCYWKMVKQMVLRRMAAGETEKEAVQCVWRQMFYGEITDETIEDMQVSIQGCKNKCPEFRTEYQQLGKEFQGATVGVV